jgi:hypothetical protein
VDSLAAAGICCNRFLGFEQIATELPAVVQQFATSDLRTVLMEVLQSYCQSRASWLAVQLIFDDNTIPTSVGALARAVGCTRNRLRDCLKQDLGHTASSLLRWNTLIRALELAARGARESEISVLLETAETTLNRDAHALVGLTFGNAVAKGVRAASMSLVELVGKHARVVP